MAKLTMRAMIIQIFAPPAEAVFPKVEPMTSISPFIANIEPSIDIHVYLKIHPMTQEYPIAKAREPKMGIIPNLSPKLRFPFRSVHIPKAPTGPAPAARPKANSPITPVRSEEHTSELQSR